jgi:hypothetical protein
MLTGVTSTTRENLQLGAGVLVKSYTENGTINPTDIIGATKGGGTFSAVPNVRSMDADGVPEDLMGFKTIDDWKVTLSTTMIEYKPDTIKMALGGNATVTTSGTSTTITAASGIVPDTDYSDVYWIGDTADGKQIVIKIKNALNSGGLTFTITNKGEGSYPLSLVGHYTVSDTKTAPFEIYR